MAFGLQWQVLLRQGSEEAVARKAGASMLWADRAGQYVGLLPAKTKRPAKRATVYAGAQLILRATGVQNLIYVSEIPGQDGYVAVGIHHRRPRQGFDHAFLRAAEVKALIDEFTKICGSEPFSLIGDARLDGIELLSLTELTLLADPSAAMRRPKLRVTPIQGVAVLVLLGGIGFAWQTYSKWRESQLAEEAVRRTQTPAEQYAQALSVVSASPLFLATGIDDYLDWVRGLPVTVGGWGVKSVDCEPKDTPVWAVWSGSNATSPRRRMRASWQQPRPSGRSPQPSTQISAPYGCRSRLPWLAPRRSATCSSSPDRGPN
ncbi:hypothetical protein ACU4GI_21805 [Cupriavidus basilensis]